MKEKIKEFKKALGNERAATDLFMAIVCFSIIAILVILSIVR